MQIEWTVLSLLVISYFAVNGFFRGWWKEAVATFVIAILILLLRQPDMAEGLVNLLNRGLNVVSDILNRLLASFSTSTGEPFDFKPDDPVTWFVLLFVMLGGASLLARLFLPGNTRGVQGQFYAPGFIGRSLGFALGILNGFLIMSLAREYLDGRSLPGADIASAVSTGDITIISSSSVGQAASTAVIEAVGLPSNTILDNDIIPWLIIGGGLLILVATLQTRVRVSQEKGGGRKVEYKPPYGYSQISIKPPKKDPPIEVKVVNP